jgi:competence protein ComEA
MRSLLLSLALAAIAILPVAAQTQPAQAAQARTTTRASRSTPPPTSPIDLNTATEAQLESLPGIGAKAAQRILEFRQKNGGFKKIEDLMGVKGIGEKSFLKLKPFITVDPKKAQPAGASK